MKINAGGRVRVGVLVGWLAAAALDMAAACSSGTEIPIPPDTSRSDTTKSALLLLPGSAMLT